VNIQERLAQYAPVQLAVDLSRLSETERSILPLLIEAAQTMDEAFWQQVYGDRATLMAKTADPAIRQYLQINYGPWDVLRNNDPFVAGVGSKPTSANFYPPDMTREEFEASAAVNPDLKISYTMVRRDASGSLVAIPYHQFFRAQVQRAADKLLQAAGLIDQASLKAYLTLRADALLTDMYRTSDFAWMDMKDNTIDILIGPIETSADRLFWQKCAYAATVLIKDWHWSERLTRITRLLPRFQEHLPVPAAYKQDKPGLESDLYVYDVVYCAGYDNASIAIGVNLPNDEEVQRLKGTRSLQLKNVMRAKFEHLVTPIADVLIAGDQRVNVTFEGFFNYVMFHEIGHGLGIRQTITDKEPVKDALKEQHYALEEGKADVLSLLVISQLHQSGDVSETELRDVYVTALANLFRQADSRQVLMQLNFFKEMGAYSRDASMETYRVNMEKMQTALETLAERLLRFQGDGDQIGAQVFLDSYGQPDAETKHDLERLDSMGWPVEIVLVQAPV
jgi:hypothetical protein